VGIQRRPGLASPFRERVGEKGYSGRDMGGDIARYRRPPLIADRGDPRGGRRGERRYHLSVLRGDGGGMEETWHVVGIEFLAMNAWRLQAPRPS
jgi:hypothetical protein